MSAITEKSLFRGAATVVLTTALYTVPAATRAIVTEIVVVNEAAAAATFDLALDGVKLFKGTSIAANTTVVIPLKEPLATGKIIAGGASATTVDFHISGVEIA